MTNQNRASAAQNFMLGAKEEFKKFIPRDTIESITVISCTEKDGAFEIKGGVGTVSPTGKLKTFGYHSTVNVNGAGKATLADLQVSDL